MASWEEIPFMLVPSALPCRCLPGEAGGDFNELDLIGEKRI